MKIAVLGGGHGCYAAAADLSESGHEVRLWRRDAAALQPVIDSGTIVLKDSDGAREVRATQRRCAARRASKAGRRWRSSCSTHCRSRRPT